MYCFHRLHFLNFPVAWFISLFAPVWVMRVDVPLRFAARFRRIHPRKLFTRDEWLMCHDEAFKAWRDVLLPELSTGHRSTLRYRGNVVDNAASVWQNQGYLYEKSHVFLQCVRLLQAREGNAAAVTVIPDSGLLLLGRKLAEAAVLPAPFRLAWRYAVLDWAYEWALSGAYSARNALYFLRSLRRTRRLSQRYSILWAGISPSEIPDGDMQLDFAWAASYGHVPPASTLYFLPVTASDAQREYLRARGINYVEPADQFTLISRVAGLRVLFAGLFYWVGAVFRPTRPGIGLIQPRLAAEAFRWMEIARSMGAGVYISSASVCWPERAEIPALRALGLRTIIWTYSANDLLCAESAENFRDQAIPRSFFMVDEFWSWHPSNVKWLRNRQVHPIEHQPESRITGALMCGDINHLRNSPAEVRARLGISEDGFYLGLFDVTPVTAEWQNRNAFGPMMITREYTEDFLRAALNLLEECPELRLLVKPKRELDDPNRAAVPAMRELYARSKSPKNSRVLLLNPDVDPYLPVAACDGALGMIFTSPVLVALGSGRHGAYFDPHRKAVHLHEHAYLQLIIRDESELARTVGNWIAGKGEQENQGIADVIPDTNAPDLAAILLPEN